jgi:hypothetical protein
VSHVDSLTLAFSLSSRRPSFISLIFNFHFLDYKQQLTLSWPWTSFFQLKFAEMNDSHFTQCQAFISENISYLSFDDVRRDLSCWLNLSVTFSFWMMMGPQNTEKQKKLGGSLTYRHTYLCITLSYRFIPGMSYRTARRTNFSTRNSEWY